MAHPFMPTLTVAKRGTYCEAVVPNRTYFKAHPCEKKHNLRLVGKLFVCAHHLTYQGC